ncbi:2-amino-4-hydroxy-6-hydroxymethyldihydropteridinepyrophosphokinase [hydrothermal vent metagenome]|uniref:2-amino-4-hydroxy-6-hydroxymethyldihydropteridine diphosphokinase n=1 Tax=hydrothermal vent metagenome TaxID=652676 RepID=A0A1W1BJL6_9ZZZZ
MYLKHSLSKDLILYRGGCFPYKRRTKRRFLRHRVVVGIGGNVGDVKRRFQHLFIFLQREKRVEIVQTSSILQNPPFGFLEQDDFFNALVVLQTNMQPFSFLAYLQKIEKKFHRKRSFANAPRTLDLDIIFFDDRVIQTKKLTLPHYGYKERDSVLIPLKELQL